MTRRWLAGWLVSVTLVAAVSGGLELLRPHVPAPSLLAPYLLAMLPVAIVWGAWFGVVVSLLSTAAFAFLFAAPLQVDDLQNMFALGIFLVISVVVGELATRSRRQAWTSARLTEEQAALRRVATLVARLAAPSEVFAAVTREVGLLCGADLARMERYESDGTVTGVAGWGRVQDELAVGVQFALEGVSIARQVRETNGPVRVGSFAGASGPIAQEAHELGIRSSVGCPIVVAGRLWGVIAASSKDEAPFPEHAESQIADFTELVATAIANAESRAELDLLLNEQAALRRVATRVAEGLLPAEIFSAVTEEVGRLFGSDAAAFARFDHDDPAIVFVGVTKNIEATLPMGTRWDVQDALASAEVYRTGGSARVDARDWSSLGGPVAAAGRRLGIVSTVASPIMVEGRSWGAISVSSADAPLPLDTEQRLEKFGELLATAIANAESREALRRLANEQAALRRVATLVARGVPPAEIFSAVSEEIDGLFGLDQATVGRFDPDGPAFVVLGVAKRDERIPIGSRLEVDDLYVPMRVFRTGRSARVDEGDLASAGGPVAEGLRSQGVISQVASPVIVEGGLWGAVTVTARETLPPDVEERLERFAELVATAIANAESRSELTASRRRIVAASDAARRRIERDLHDGTQQRLVSLGMTLSAAEAELPPGTGDLRAELSHIATGLADAVAELQEISRGIHPAILSHGGLGPALRTLARRSAIPVALDLSTDTRVPEPIEVAAYYVASEALANATKHARASYINVSLTQRNGALLLSIRDDGIGGADPSRGSGLVGLTDRVEALGGSIQVRSGAGAGTHITAELPLEQELADHSG